MSKWKRFKRRLRRLVHPNVWDMKAAIRLGEMRERKKASIRLPPIFGERPVYIPVLVCVPPEKPVIPSPRGSYFKQYRHAYSQTELLPRIKPLRLERYDGPPLEEITEHRTPAFLR